MVEHCKCVWFHNPQFDWFSFTWTWCFSTVDRLIEIFYKWIFSKSFFKSATKDWDRYLWGIFTCCTLSVIIFLAGMNTIILGYSMEARVPIFCTNNTSLPLIHAFMDDLSLMFCTVSGAQTILSPCIPVLTLTGLEFKADKSHFIVIFNGGFMNATPYMVLKASN